MRLHFLTYLILSILLTSCTNNFKNHQPIDEKDVEFFFKRKSEFLTLCYELNTSTKTIKIINEPY